MTLNGVVNSGKAAEVREDQRLALSVTKTPGVNPKHKKLRPAVEVADN
jgi:hypothetical protein